MSFLLSSSLRDPNLGVSPLPLLSPALTGISRAGPGNQVSREISRNCLSCGRAEEPPVTLSLLLGARPHWKSLRPLSPPGRLTIRLSQEMAKKEKGKEKAGKGKKKNPAGKLSRAARVAPAVGSIAVAAALHTALRLAGAAEGGDFKTWRRRGLREPAG